MGMCSVILMHSANYMQLPSASMENLLIQRLICQTWTCWAVPFFFALSGFLFVHSMEVPYGRLLMKKVRTLLVPYVIWAVAGGLFQLAVVAGSRYFSGGSVCAGTFMQYGSLLQKINSLLGLSCYDMIGNGLVGPVGDRPLWYVRSLFIIFLVSPILVFTYRRMPWALCCAVICFIFICPYFDIPILAVKLMDIGYFCLGILMYGVKDKIAIPTPAGWLCGICGIIVSLMAACDHISECLAVRILPILVFVFSVVMSRYLQKWGERSEMVNHTFFVYCLHSLLIYFFPGMAFRLFGRSDTVSLLAMFAAPFLTLACCYAIVFFLKRKAPRLLTVLSGGRG